MPRSVEVISHWHHSIRNLSASALDFYAAIETALYGKQAPIRPDRVDYRESGLLSAKREYLRISYARFSFDICAFPFGKDYYFSWWLVRRLPDFLAIGCIALILLFVIFAICFVEFGPIKGLFAFLVLLGFAAWFFTSGPGAETPDLEDTILAVPLLGRIYQRVFRPATYYSEDSRIMFEETIHQVVVDHISALLQAHGMRVLAPEEAKPQSRNPIR